MRRPIVVALLSAALLAVVAVPTFRLAAQSGGEYIPDRQVLFPASQRSALSVNEYLSPAVATPRSFSHLLVRHDASIPQGATLTLYVRASIDGASWTDWAALEENEDLWSEADGADVHWSQIIDVGALAAYWQLRAAWTAGDDGTAPELRQIDVNTVNTLVGPDPVAEPVPDTKSRSAELAGAVPKPGVISRSAWGSPDGQGSRAAPEYRAVTHMVVHHTADSNTLTSNEPNWAARVRAIWSYHAITRGWGDIGYNYLIDPNGVIYEGRAGGDNTVAFHDTANYGSMGVALLGTYSSVTPSETAQNALVAVLAWKASQRGIDPQGSSSYYGCLRSSYCQPYHP
ncbi:MAG TPA: N-acetylmuramoyl-L-alanine amidase, partial [Roseiflexaceae bacterium]|nr:N-acetylmuramoyl-L-alanine amidase [Roseiflexaceae bacterium]